jgi:hypothetical protein
MAALIVVVLVAIGIALVLTPGLVFLAIVPFALAVIAAGWLVLAAIGRTRPSEAARRTHDPDLLGPGGPDDPDR